MTKNIKTYSLKWYIITLLVLICFKFSQSKDLQSDYLRKRMQCNWKTNKTNIIKNQENQQQKIMLNFFNNNFGDCLMIFFDNSTMDTFAQISVNTVMIRLYDPKYIDNKIIHIFIPLGNSYNKNLNKWQSNNTSVHYQLLDHLAIVSKGQISMNYVIQQDMVELQFITKNQEKLNHIILINYWLKQRSMILPIIFILFNIFLIALSQRVKKSNIISQKISLLTLYHAITFMLFLSVLQLLLGIDQIPSSYSWFIVSGILTVILAIRLIQIFEDTVHRMIGIRGYLTFYISLFGYLWLLINFGTNDWVLILNSLGFIPQIAHNIRYGNRLGFHLQYIAILASNQGYVLYLKGCQNNILKYQPKLMLCYILIIIILIQILIILCQNIYGPLFFIPKSCLPGYHNYFQEIQRIYSNSQKMEEIQQCPICLVSLWEEPQSNLSLFDNSVKSNAKHLVPMQMKITIMKTPCGHRFHIKCLEDWMEYKHECPIDRNYLPPIL